MYPHSTMQRTIYISSALIDQCIKAKDSLDALAFCVMVKQMFVSSTVKNATYRRMKQLFGIGNDKLKRLVCTATSMGLISFSDDRTLTVGRLRNKGLNYRIGFEHQTREEDTDIRTLKSIAEIVKMLRGEFLTNHLRKQQRNVDAKHSCSDPSTLREYKRSRHYCMSHDITAAYDWLSNQRICRLLGVSLRTVRNVLSPLIQSGAVRRVPSYFRTSIEPNACSHRSADYAKHTLGMEGYIFKSQADHCVYLRLADRFVLDNPGRLTYLSI